MDIWLIHFPDSLTSLADILGFIDGAMQSGEVGPYCDSNHSAPIFARGLPTGKYDALAPIVGPSRKKALSRFADRFFTARALSQLQQLSQFCARNAV